MQTDLVQPVPGSKGAQLGGRGAELVQSGNQWIAGLIGPGGRGQKLQRLRDIEHACAFDQAQTIIIETTDMHGNFLLCWAQASASCR
ncbi:hypothetical protein D3C78_1465490 [compost metagenome]